MSPQKKRHAVNKTESAKTFDKQIKQLVTKGKKTKKLDQKDIFKLIPDTPANIDVLEFLYTALAQANIEIIEVAEPDPSSFSD